MEDPVLILESGERVARVPHLQQERVGVGLGGEGRGLASDLPSPAQGAETLFLERSEVLAVPQKLFFLSLVLWMEASFGDMVR